jgi:hypothetical protein
LVTRTLGIIYIWIDSLYILQGDQDDWAIEAEKMGSYYGQAWLTIFAFGAPNCTTGALARITNNDKTMASLSTENGLQFWIRKLPEHFSMAADGPAIYQAKTLSIFYQGWVFQERLLSRRTLHLGPEEMV